MVRHKTNKLVLDKAFKNRLERLVGRSSTNLIEDKKPAVVSKKSSKPPPDYKKNKNKTINNEKVMNFSVTNNNNLLEHNILLEKSENNLRNLSDDIYINNNDLYLKIPPKLITSILKEKTNLDNYTESSFIKKYGFILILILIGIILFFIFYYFRK